MNETRSIGLVRHASRECLLASVKSQRLQTRDPFHTPRAHCPHSSQKNWVPTSDGEEARTHACKRCMRKKVSVK